MAGIFRAGIAGKKKIKKKKIQDKEASGLKTKNVCVCKVLSQIEFTSVELRASPPLVMNTDVHQLQEAIHHYREPR